MTKTLARLGGLESLKRYIVSIETMTRPRQVLYETEMRPDETKTRLKQEQDKD
jgi:hypothetical protein